MADLCRQCAARICGKNNPGDFLRPEAPKDGVFFEICEGCGPTHVDVEGNCLDHEECSRIKSKNKEN